MFVAEPVGVCQHYDGGYPRYKPQPLRSLRDVLDDGVPLMLEAPNAYWTDSKTADTSPQDANDEAKPLKSQEATGLVRTKK